MPAEKKSQFFLNQALRRTDGHLQLKISFATTLSRSPNKIKKTPKHDQTKSFHHKAISEKERHRVDESKIIVQFTSYFIWTTIELYKSSLYGLEYIFSKIKKRGMEFQGQEIGLSEFIYFCKFLFTLFDTTNLYFGLLGVEISI